MGLSKRSQLSRVATSVSLTKPDISSSGYCDADEYCLLDGCCQVHLVLQFVCPVSKHFANSYFLYLFQVGKTCSGIPTCDTGEVECGDG